MNHDIKRRIPEMTLPQVDGWLKNNVLLGNLSETDAQDLMTIILDKMATYFERSYLALKKPADRGIFLATWTGGLCDLTTRQIFAGLDACLTGKTAYVDKPPPNVIAFHKVCKESSFPAYYFEPTAEIEALPALENASKRDRSLAIAAQMLERARGNLGKLRRTPYLPSIKTFTQVSTGIVSKAEEQAPPLIEEKSVSGIPGL